MSINEFAELYKIAMRLAEHHHLEAGWGFDQMNRVIVDLTYMPLDNIGIETTKVRDLATEFEAQGMEQDEAFLRAVLEEGRKTIAAIAVSG